MDLLLHQIDDEGYEIGVVCVVPIDHIDLVSEVPRSVFETSFFDSLKRSTQPSIPELSLRKRRDDLTTALVGVVEFQSIERLFKLFEH
jgi:hypothetical protein